MQELSVGGRVARVVLPALALAALTVPGLAPAEQLAAGTYRPVAATATDASSISAVRQALQNDPVYVAADAEAAGLVDADALRRTIGDAPIVVAVLPAAATRAVPSGSADDLPAAIGGRRAVVVLAGRSLRAAASSSVLPAGRAGQVARDAQRAHSGAFDRQNVQAALDETARNLRSSIENPSSGSTAGSNRSGTTSDESSGSGSALPWVLGGLAVVGGVGYLASRRRRRAREQQQVQQTAAQTLAGERAEVQSLYNRLGADVSTLDPGSDPVARQALADASERYTSAGGMLSTATTSGEIAAAGHALAEGLHASRVARQRLGLDPGPPIPEPQRQDQQALQQQQQVQVGGQQYDGYPSYAPGAPNYFPGGTVNGGYVPGGWYRSRFWEGALLGGLAGTVLTGGLGGYGLGGFGLGGYGLGGYGFGGYGSGYGMGYGSGYESGYEQGSEQNGGDWSGDGGDSSGGDWGGGGDFGGGDWGGGGDLGGGGDFGGGGGGDW
ncbi:MAG: hypothetical protein QOJ32_3102 [Frankiaceae bacterium]|jgi:hypothetical protein|nr:hypothetical protein [Frankiaceae bacterium]